MSDTQEAFTSGDVGLATTGRRRGDRQAMTGNDTPRDPHPHLGITPRAPHPHLGLWATADGFIRQELLPDGRYDEARDNRGSTYTGGYTVTGPHPTVPPTESVSAPRQRFGVGPAVDAD